MSDFSVKFRGVRGSFPVANENFLQYGGNTACVEINAGNNKIILDGGTGIVSCGDDLLKSYISSAINPEDRNPMKIFIFLSHIHLDHIQGLVFFKPMHVKSSQVDIFGDGNNNSDLKDNLSQLLFGKTFPLDLGDIACDINIHNLCDDYIVIIKPDSTSQIVKKDSASPEEDDIVISFYKSYVHPQNGVIIYKISYKGKSVIYATDKECYLGGDKKFIKFAQNCDLLIHDSQYSSEDYLDPVSPKQGFGHSTFDMAIDIGNLTNSKNLAFFHYDPSYDDDKLNQIKEHYTSAYPNVIMSYEGLEVDIL